MSAMKHVIGIDISTQTITAMLIGVVEENGSPTELVVSSAWTESRLCRDEINRKSPGTWIKLIRECIADLKLKARESETAEAIGISTTFPGVFAILGDGSIDPKYVSLYDNIDSAGVCNGGSDELLGRAEIDTLNRMWPGNMAIGLIHLVKTQGLDLNQTKQLVSPNAAFAHELLHLAGREYPGRLPVDFTQTTISGLYNSLTAEKLPGGVADLLTQALPEYDISRIRSLLPDPVPSWRNIVPDSALTDVRRLLGLPGLRSISIGAGDSPLGSLALNAGPDTVINVRGSSDSPMIMVDSPKPRTGSRETVLHYPLPTATSLSDAPWCVVAPTLRSGRVWDWVRNLRYTEKDSADSELESLALQALKKRLSAPAGAKSVRFDTALGGERAPVWDAHATGSITGLTESHTIGDIALAALEGMSRKLSGCIELMEDRYDTKTSKMLLFGGPARNRLWNWITQVYTGKRTFATTFSDASLLGAALLGYGAAYDGLESDASIARRLFALSKLSSTHPLVAPVPVEPPDPELADMTPER